MTGEQYRATLLALRELIDRELISEALKEAPAAPAPVLKSEEIRLACAAEISRVAALGKSYSEMTVMVTSHPDWRWDRRMESARLREVQNGGVGGRNSGGLKNTEKLAVITKVLKGVNV